MVFFIVSSMIFTINIAVFVMMEINQNFNYPLSFW